MLNTVNRSFLWGGGSLKFVVSKNPFISKRVSSFSVKQPMMTIKEHNFAYKG